MTLNPTVELTLGSDVREGDIEFELNGGVDFGERRGVRVPLNPTVALTLRHGSYFSFKYMQEQSFINSTHTNLIWLILRQNTFACRVNCA